MNGTMNTGGRVGSLNLLWRNRSSHPGWWSVVKSGSSIHRDTVRHTSAALTTVIVLYCFCVIGLTLSLNYCTVQ